MDRIKKLISEESERINSLRIQINKNEKVIKITRILILIMIPFTAVFMILACYNSIAFHYNELAKNFSKDNPNGEFFKVLLTVFGGLAFLYGLFLNSRRIKAQTDQNKISGDSNSDKRFGDAIGFLNDENEGIVLGGIYVLYQLAKEDDRYKSIVANLLCSYLKQKSKSLYSKFELENEDSSDAPIIVRTIIDILFNNDSVFEKEEIKLDNVLLKRICFNKKINDCDFHSSKFRLCSFKSDVIHCDFSHSEMRSCSFGGLYNSSIISHCDFSFTNIYGCHFDNPKSIMEWNFFSLANIEDTSFSALDANYLHFIGTRFKKVHFIISNIHFSDFSNSNFDNVVFENVKSFAETRLKQNKEHITFKNCSNEPS